MLTVLSMAFVLWQSPYSCPGGCPGSGGGFPIFSGHHGCEREWNLFHHGDCWALLFPKCVCPVGMAVPCGDPFAAQMHEGYPLPGQAYYPPASPITSQPATPAAPQPGAAAAPQPGAPANSPAAAPPPPLIREPGERPAVEPVVPPREAP